MTSAPTSGVSSLAGWSPSSVGRVVGADSSSSFSVGGSETKKYKELKKNIYFLFKLTSKRFNFFYLFCC